MDTFDKTIKAARATTNPNKQFVEVTMQQITNNTNAASTPIEDVAPKKRRFSLKFWLPLSVGLVGVLTLAVVSLSLWRPASQPNNTTVASNSQPVENGNTSTASFADIDNAISDISKSLDTESTAQADTSSGLDDSTQQVTIPTE